MQQRDAAGTGDVVVGLDRLRHVVCARGAYTEDRFLTRAKRPRILEVAPPERLVYDVRLRAAAAVDVGGGVEPSHDGNETGAVQHLRERHDAHVCHIAGKPDASKCRVLTIAVGDDVLERHQHRARQLRWAWLHHSDDLRVVAVAEQNAHAAAEGEFSVGAESDAHAGIKLTMCCIEQNRGVADRLANERQQSIDVRATDFWTGVPADEGVTHATPHDRVALEFAFDSGCVHDRWPQLRVEIGGVLKVVVAVVVGDGGFGVC